MYEKHYVIQRKRCPWDDDDNHWDTLDQKYTTCEEAEASALMQLFPKDYGKAPSTTMCGNPAYTAGPPLMNNSTRRN